MILTRVADGEKGGRCLEAEGREELLKTHPKDEELNSFDPSTSKENARAIPTDYFERESRKGRDCLKI